MNCVSMSSFLQRFKNCSASLTRIVRIITGDALFLTDTSVTSVVNVTTATSATNGTMSQPRLALSSSARGTG